MCMFRPVAAIVRFSFESMVVVLIGLVWLYQDGEISTSDVCYELLLREHGRGGGGDYTTHITYPPPVSLNNSKHHRC